MALYVNYRQSESDLREELFREEVADAMQFQGILEYMLRQQAFEQIQEEIAVSGMEPAVAKVLLIGPDNVVEASTAYTDRGKTFESVFPDLAGTGYQTLLAEARKTQQYRILLLDELDCWVLFQPVVFATSNEISPRLSIGFLVRKIDLGWVEKSSLDNLVWSLIPTFIPLVMGAILFGYLAYYLHLKRLRQLSHLVKEISQGRVDSVFDENTLPRSGFLGFITRQSNKFIEHKQQELTDAVAQIALREEGLSLMLDSIGDAVIATDTEARVIRMNPVAENLTAWNFDAAEGQLLEEVFPIVHSTTEEPLINPVTEVLQTGEMVNFKNHTLLRSRDGSEYQISDSAAPIKNKDGVIQGVILIFRDITENYRLQQRIHERNQLLEAVMNNMPQLLYIKDLEGKFVKVNRSFEAAFSSTDNVLVGKTDFDLFKPEMAEQYHADDQQVIQSGQTLTWQNEAEGETGLRKYLTTKFPLYDINDQIYAICGLSTDISEQFLLSRELEGSKKDFQAIIDHAPAVIYTRDLDGRFLLANKNLVDSLGLTLEEVIGKDRYEIMPKETADQHLGNEEVVLESGKSQEFIESFMMNNSMHHFFSIKYPLFDENNEIYAIGGISTDYTERYELEQAVRTSEQHMRLHRDQNPLAFIEWNPDLEVLDWNPAAEKLFGYTREEALGRGAGELIVPDHLQAYIGELRQSLISQTGGESSTNENVTKAGKLIYCQWQNTSITDEQGDVISVVSLVSDISEKSRIQGELEAQEVEQHQILNHIVDGVITYDDVGIILSFNRSSEVLFGYDSSEVIGSHLNILVPETDKTDYQSDIQHYIETGNSTVIGANRTVKGRRKSGEIFSMRLSVAELPLSPNGRQRFVGSCIDVTEIEQQELQMQQVQKMEALGKLTGGIAHDYNNMLGVILGYVELLEGKLNTPEAIRYVSNIEKAGLRGVNLTKKLLSFSRKKAIEAELVQLNVLLADERDMLEKTLTLRITLTMDLQPELWSVWIDKGEFEDALLNLAINAMHAMDGVGHLNITTTNQSLGPMIAKELGIPAGEYILFAIEDDGIGINESVRPRIFDPFFSTKGDDGTGLGLSQVYGFIQRCGGGIRVDPSVSVGSRFELYFPRYIPPLGDIKIDDKPDLISLRGTETILVVDDEPAIREITDAVLSEYGYRVEIARDAQQALKLLSSVSIDLVISDVIMPGMDGYQLAREIKHQYPQVKVQLVSGFTGEYQPDALDSELQHQLLTKPVPSKLLLEKIRRLLDQ